MQDGELPSSWPGSRARLAAFAVDSLILELIGVLVGMLHLDTLAAPSTMTRVSGIFLILGYYGILCSRVGGGQTFGMKLFTFRVVGDDGKPLELLRSLARALVLCAPFLLNGIIFNGYSSNADLGLLIVAGTIAFGAGLAQLSLLAFNRSSRRLLHDILLRSNAICIEHELPVTQGGPRLSRTSRALVGTSFSVALVAMTFLPILVATQHKDALLKNVQIAVQTLPEVAGATATNSTSIFVQGVTKPITTPTLVVSAHLRSWPTDAAAEITRIGERIIAMYAVEPGQKVWIELSYGDSVGIVNGHRAYSGFYVARQHVALIHPLFPHSVSVNPAVVTLRPHDLSSTCAVRTPSQISFTWPKRIAMTTQSIWTFERYNQNGYGTMLVRTHFDGTVQALIAPTPDIDAHLHVALADIVKKIRFAPTTKCRAGFATFLVHFAVPSGTISAAQLHPWTPAATQERT